FLEVPPGHKARLRRVRYTIPWTIPVPISGHLPSLVIESVDIFDNILMGPYDFVGNYGEFIRFSDQEELILGSNSSPNFARPVIVRAYVRNKFSHVEPSLATI